MKVPYSWLREYVEVTVEPQRLAEDLTLAGLELAGLERVDGDVVFDLDITTNRVDCMNVYGVAREAAVLYGLPLKPLETAVTEAGTPAEGALSVVVEAPELCPRFAARVLDVRLGESPEWLKRRLEAVGVRPINNVVDLTNYVMMEMGQPSHAFDLAKIPQTELRIRWARSGEKLVTLDGVERTLTPRCGVVASPGPGLALAGVMGGASSEVTGTTRVVALEAAYWAPLAIRRSAKDAGVKTEASHRFERGADPEGPTLALDRIAHLLEKIGAGSARPGVIDRRPVARERRHVVLRPARLRAVLGVEVPKDKAGAILAGLGFVAQGGEAAATFRARSISSRRSAGISGSTRSPRPFRRPVASKGYGLRRGVSGRSGTFWWERVSRRSSTTPSWLKAARRRCPASAWLSPTRSPKTRPCCAARWSCRGS
jgi:phenylalanyl-tRNA synthetase beta chain